MLRVALIHETLLLVDQLLLKLLLLDFFHLNVAGHLAQLLLLLRLLPLRLALYLVRVQLLQILVLLYLAHDALHCLTVLLGCRHLARRLCQFGKSKFGFGNVFGQDVIDIIVLTLLLTLDFVLVPILQNQLQLLALLHAQLVRILQQLDQLFVS